MPRRISIRKVIQTLVTLVAVAGCAVAMISADRRQAMRRVADVQLTVKGPAGVRFLTEDAVRSMLFSSRHIDPVRCSVMQLDERSMEAILRNNPWVESAEVYTDAKRTMHIRVMQRVPVVRIFEEDGNSYYLDRFLKAMPLSAAYTHYTPVVTGVIRLAGDSTGIITRGTILGLIDNINRDTFWRAQVSQLNMRADGGFEIVPLLGTQRIILGDTAHLHQKLSNLFAFYRQVQSKVGWDKYITLDLRYDGQVIATPSLPWKAPVDKALSTMSWVKAIMDNAPARQGQLGGDATAYADSVSAADAAVYPKPFHGTDTMRNAKPVIKPPGATANGSSATLLTPALKPHATAHHTQPPGAAHSTIVARPKNTTPHYQNTLQNAAPKR